MTDIRYWSAADAARHVRYPLANDDKYARGVVGFRTGSARYPGAAVLGVEAAWRTGTGMVRFVGHERAGDHVLAQRPETVVADGRVQAWVIGSGTDAAARSDQETSVLCDILSGRVPVVVDAGALSLSLNATAPVIITPHDREHARLRTEWGLDDGRGAPKTHEDTPPKGAVFAESAATCDRATSAIETARALGGVVVLKGATTIIADPAGVVLAVESGVPWLATAGTGDVLAGVMGAIIAAPMSRLDSGADRGVPGDPPKPANPPKPTTTTTPTGPAGDMAPSLRAVYAGGDERTAVYYELAARAATAAWIHGRAGARAAGRHGPAGGPITALDVATEIPAVMGELFAARAGEIAALPH